MENESVVPKMACLDFPKYNGAEDSKGWLNHHEHFFKLQKTLEEEKMEIVAYHIEGDVQSWSMKLNVIAPE